ncbi:MAG: TatD family hydrolase [Casimicrobiaceae bacterium]|nr:TatD family hydrolase [Casimicrobiaceae bacterium]MCX8098309.1 TatD family hydrolase [Casimicrobiaceae bacterium]MDW8311755.1 TatD family hydrolase [Burkholderiales bacterium]
MWIDSHCHLDAPEFDRDREQVVARARAAGVAALVNLPGHVEHFEAARESRARYGCLTGYGIHPMWVAGPSGRSRREAIEVLAAWLERERPELVGEIGLDFFVTDTDRTEQEWFFVEQLKLARRFDLPVSLHVRKSQDRLLYHLRRIRVRGGFAHAFNGSSQQAAEFIKLGFCLGFGGAATFPQARNIRRLLAEAPLEAIVVETDAPDIPPAFLGTMGSRARNSPEHLPAIGAILAQVRGMTPEAFAEATSANVRRILARS